MSNVLDMTMLVVLMIFLTITCIALDENDEQIKQLKQSNIEITQECEVYKNRSAEYENRCLELENMLESCGLIVDNCECR